MEYKIQFYGHIECGFHLNEGEMEGHESDILNI